MHMDCILIFHLIIIFEIGISKLFELRQIIFIIRGELIIYNFICSLQQRILKSAIE